MKKMHFALCDLKKMSKQSGLTFLNFDLKTEILMNCDFAPLCNQVIHGPESYRLFKEDLPHSGSILDSQLC